MKCQGPHSKAVDCRVAHDAGASFGTATYEKEKRCRNRGGFDLLEEVEDPRPIIISSLQFVAKYIKMYYLCWLKCFDK